MALGRCAAAHEQPIGAQSPCERLRVDTHNGDGVLFARQDAIESAWAVVEPVLAQLAPVHTCAPGTWGPTAADHFLAGDGGWHKPEVKD